MTDLKTVVADLQNVTAQLKTAADTFVAGHPDTSAEADAISGVVNELAQVVAALTPAPAAPPPPPA